MPTPGPSLVLTYEGVALGATVAELTALAAANGWRHNAQPPPLADQQVTVFTTPDHPVKRYRLGFEADRLVNIQIDYRAPDPARAELRHRFAERRQLDGAWYLTDPDHAVLASVTVDGSAVRALDLAHLRDQREGQALLRSAFAPPARSDER